MSIPLERLYHYIEQVTEEIWGNHVVIYLFYPYGSKNIQNLTEAKRTANYTWEQRCTLPQIFCNDQEPLNFDFYQDTDLDSSLPGQEYTLKIISQENVVLPKKNLRSKFSAGFLTSVYDKVLLLHSEQRSDEIKKYQDSDYIPVYYWNHAILARDWFRYAQHETIKKNQPTGKFLIYNRAWSGTREYRLKFIDCLIENNLDDHCITWVNAIEPDSKIHYQNYCFHNTEWKPKNVLEDYFCSTHKDSNHSADFDSADYSKSDFEIVLETLFDDTRLHLTEKTLRPIACGQPFLLMATHGSLAYLRSYGFQTFGQIIDESYDLIINPKERMMSVIKSMKQIASWDLKTRKEKINQLVEITKYNQTHFFSQKFFDLITTELYNNFKSAFFELETTNTSSHWIDRRKQWSKNPVLKKFITDVFPYRDRQDLTKVLGYARKYYVRSLSSSINNK
jgi:hypothetical protein